MLPLSTNGIKNVNHLISLCDAPRKTIFQKAKLFQKAATQSFRMQRHQTQDHQSTKNSFERRNRNAALPLFKWTKQCTCALISGRKSLRAAEDEKEKKKKMLAAECSRGGRVSRLRCKMDSYKFMNSVRKVKRRQYDNLAVIAFFLPPTVFRPSRLVPSMWRRRLKQRWPPGQRVHSDLVAKAVYSAARGQVVVTPNTRGSWVMG